MARVFKPITERCNAKPKQTRITFDTQMKIALFQLYLSALQVIYSIDIVGIKENWKLVSPGNYMVDQLEI